MNKYIAMSLSLLCLYPASIFASSINWSWSFVQPNVVATTGEYLDIYITIKNDITSVNSIDLSQSGFDFFDGTFGYIGVITDENNNYIYTTTLWPPPPIALDPGEEVSFLGFSLTSMRDLEVGDVVDINPKFYIEPGSYNKHADNSLLIYLVAVPLISGGGTIKTADDTSICAMVLASGQYMFSCNPVGVFSLTDLPREDDGTVKRQIYADGFIPKIDVLTESSSDAVVMTRSGTCPTYNTPYDPGVFPGSAGNRINISGKVLLQNSQTPVCAMVLANGQYMFSCDGSGNYALNIPLDNNGQYKLQVYADGFAPVIQTFDEFQATNDVRMARATECQ